MTRTTIACVQMDVALGRPEENRGRVVERLRHAAGSGARLVIFPECAVTGYCFESLAEIEPFAEPLAGPTAEAVAAACSESGAYAVVGFIERDGARLYNAAMVVGPEGPLGSYRKVHMPFIGADRFLTPGDRPFQLFELPFGKLGVNICYDSSFPEPSRVLKLLGAELIALPTNWPPGAWRTPEFVLNTRAQENHLHVAAANRVGTERGWGFIGRSKVVNCGGDTQAEAGGEREEILLAELDLGESNHNRVVNVAGAYEIDRMADRRPDFYGPVTDARAERPATEKAAELATSGD
ncbi:MAG TPA: carbon-nitrogen hydrolase family protein [Pyrinomonadaceae bacterium]|nr:carbon-nitrogen hydrolase family protein [Pyrinomonadaceae bacterium]